MKVAHLNECQLVNLPQVAEQSIWVEKQTLSSQIKRLLAKPWNYTIKPWLKLFIKQTTGTRNRLNTKDLPVTMAKPTREVVHLQIGDRVRVRSREEILAMLDQWKEYRGCAFLENMWQYCGSEQHVFRVMERFLDERDYRVKKTKGLVLLDGLYCEGTPVFGRCDRSCLLFWREEWLDKIE